MKQAKFLKISWKDVGKGLIVSILTSFLTGLQMYFADGHTPTNGQLKVLAMVSIGAGLGYLLKNLLTNSDDQFLKKEDRSKLGS